MQVEELAARVDESGNWAVLEQPLLDYIDFHLRTIACPYCLANLADLESLQKEPPPKTQARRRRFFESSAGYLHIARDGK